ncbi:hypothetical protein [Sporosarcina aquimarina]|nr:hypothetical protein [Sporosarcina aquimarina]MBY0221970.1 hypothetical protein [Sporosarcina aquimarina]
MNNVIDDLKDWLNTFDHSTDGYKDTDAITCIQNAIEELEKYHTHYDNEK